MNVAQYFTKFTDERINDLIITPPPDLGKEKQSQWVRGYIKYRPAPDSDTRDLVITGPKLRSCYGGAKWNKVVFAMPKVGDEQDAEVKQFREWLGKLTQKVKTTIWEGHEKFKPGSKSNARFTFDEDLIKPANDPDKYPDELRCRLSTRRREQTDAEREENSDSMFDPTGDHSEIVDTDIFTIVDGVKTAVEPTSIMPRSSMRPIIRFAYSRRGDSFGMVLTITKAQYFPNEGYQGRVANNEWVMDIPETVPETVDSGAKRSFSEMADSEAQPGPEREGKNTKLNGTTASEEF